MKSGVWSHCTPEPSNTVRSLSWAALTPGRFFCFRLKKQFMHTRSFARFCISILSTSIGFAAQAHEKNAPFSGAIIDPFELHHAHIENEQRVNLSRATLRDPQSGARTKTYASELELAWASPDFRYGFEVFIPYLQINDPEGAIRNSGVGDIEIRPIKYALINEPELVVATATGITLPTGDEARGLGEGYASVRQFLFVDKAAGNWFFGLNLGVGTGLKSGTASELEYGAVAAYSFISGTAPGAVAPTHPGQRVVWTPSLELIGARSFGGEEGGQRRATLIGGLNAWFPRSGWQMRIGMAVPASQAREADRAILFQIGNHFNWDELF